MTAPLPRLTPTVNDVTRPFWIGGARNELLIQRCRSCRVWHHPPLARCTGCGARDLRHEPTGGRGTVFTFSVAHHPHRAGQPVPVAVAIVELDEQEGLRINTNIVGCPSAEVRIGMPVEVRFEPLGGGLFAPLFTPVAHLDQSG